MLLTNREYEVLKLLVKGLSNNQISEELNITNHTTKAHLSSIYEKLKVANRVQAVVKYFELVKQKQLL